MKIKGTQSVYRDFNAGDDATLHDAFTAMWLEERERYGTPRRKARKLAWEQLIGPRRMALK